MKIDKISFIGRLQFLACIELAIMFAYSLSCNVICDDSGSYEQAWLLLKQGNLDDFRTPVYPFLCGILSDMFGPGSFRPVLYIIQCFVFILSIGWMRGILAALIPNGRVVKWFTAIYALNPGPLVLCCLQLTEALSLAGVTGLLYLIVNVVQNRSVRAAWWSVPLLTVLVMLRPVFIYLVGCLMVFWLVMLVARRGCKSVWISLAGCVLAAGVIVAYSSALQRQYGFWGTSIVSDFNGYFTLRQAGVMKPGEATDPNVRRFMDTMLTEYSEFPGDEAVRSQATGEVTTLYRGFGPVLLKDFVREEMALHPEEIMIYLIRYRLLYLLEEECVYGGFQFTPVRMLTKPFSSNNGTAMLIFLIVVIILARQYLKERKKNALLWLFCLLFMAIYVTVWLSAYSEWPRLLIPNYPVLLTLSGWLLARLSAYFSQDFQALEQRQR